MKKLKLDLKNVGEILTREQLRQVKGGFGSVNCSTADPQKIFCCAEGTIRGRKDKCYPLWSSGCTYVVDIDDNLCPHGSSG